MKFVNIGFGNMVSSQRVLAVVNADSAPVKRLIQQAREKNLLIDATFGRKTNSVVVMDSDTVVLSALSSEKISARMQGEDDQENAEE